MKRLLRKILCTAAAVQMTTLSAGAVTVNDSSTINRMQIFLPNGDLWGTLEDATDPEYPFISPENLDRTYELLNGIASDVGMPYFYSVREYIDDPFSSISPGDWETLIVIRVESDDPEEKVWCFVEPSDYEIREMENQTDPAPIQEYLMTRLVIGENPNENWGLFYYVCDYDRDGYITAKDLTLWKRQMLIQRGELADIPVPAIQ